MSENRQTARFMIDGEVVVADVAPVTTLLQYLRDDMGRTGTKEGCAEGDCGACTVVLGELVDGRVRYRAINSCVRFVATLDGKEIVTVESLEQPNGQLHPVQQAMVDEHASQCGFCTPGFVMSLFALYLENPDADRATVVDALAGNLCRCTGYRPIIDAGCKMGSYPEPERWSPTQARTIERTDALRALVREESLEIEAAPGFFAPRTIDELAQRYLATPNALLLGGGTDIGLWVTKLHRELPALIYLCDVAELARITQHGSMLEIGAAVTLTDGYEALVDAYPSLAELALRFASPPVRNSGTLCGNIANGSPIGDSMPALIALGAQVVLQRGPVTRELPLEDLYLGYQKKALQTGEFVRALRVPLPDGSQRMSTYKVSKRFDQDISAVCAAYSLRISYGHIEQARVAHGGMAATPKRATATEAALNGQPFNVQTFLNAAPCIASDYAPIADMRASASYRLDVAQNLLMRFYYEHSGTHTVQRVTDLAGI